MIQAIRAWLCAQHICWKRRYRRHSVLLHYQRKDTKMSDEELMNVTCAAIEPFHFAVLDLRPEVLEAVGSPEWFWKDSILNVHFMNGSQQLKERVAAIANEWTQYMSRRFRFYYDAPPLRYRRIPKPGGGQVRVPVGLATDIAISFWSNGGGRSYIGSYSRQISRTGQPSMELPLSGERRIVLHEFGHALGLHHEHQNPTQNIRWNVPAVYNYYAQNYGWSKEMVDNNVLTKLSSNTTNFTVFDDKSIMLYPIPAQLTLDGYSTGWNQELSSEDKRFVRRVYP